MGAALYGLLRTFMCSLQQFSLEVKSVLYFSHLISDISEVHSVTVGLLLLRSGALSLPWVVSMLLYTIQYRVLQ